MVREPKDLIGKWFSNVTGRPEWYYYILELGPSKVAKWPVFEATYIQLKPRDIEIRTNNFRNLSVFGDPLIKTRQPELQYQIHKCIKYLFEKEVKWHKK
jgi:hypothetical protein